VSALVTLLDEVRCAQELDRPLSHIRVTVDALKGSPVLVPITPERARQIRLVAVEDRGEFTVEADPEVWLRQLELLVHPADWMEVQIDSGAWRYLVGPSPLRAFSFAGVAVIHS
jgi:hypothetical protein